jgi:hypothetical protein
MKRAFGIVLAAIGTFLALGRDSARAEMITYEISGVVGSNITDESTDHYVPTAIAGGETYAGTISFNNAATGSLSGNDGYYRGTALDLSVNITIDGQYQYSDSTPSSSDEIDLLGTTFSLYKRGPVVSANFAPDPPFSHLDFQGTTNTNILANAPVLTATSSGVGDTEAAGSPYYYISARLTSVEQVVPEPGTCTLLAVGAAICLGLYCLRSVRVCE